MIGLWYAVAMLEQGTDDDELYRLHVRYFLGAVRKSQELGLPLGTIALIQRMMARKWFDRSIANMEESPENRAAYEKQIRDGWTDPTPEEEEYWSKKIEWLDL
jgi:hypothetical protein